MFDSKYKKFNNVFYIENNRNTLIKINSFSYDIESNFTETIVGNNLIKILDSNQYFESVTKRVWAAEKAREEEYRKQREKREESERTGGLIGCLIGSLFFIIPALLSMCS